MAHGLCHPQIYDVELVDRISEIVMNRID